MSTIPADHVNRTAYLTKELDRQMGKLSQQGDISKSEYMRRLVEWAVKNHIVLSREAFKCILLTGILFYGICTLSPNVRAYRGRSGRRQESYYATGELV